MEQKFLNDSTNTKVPVRTKTWFVILMLIVFFPVGLWLMWAYKKNWNIIVKLLITAFFAYCFIVSDSKPNNSTDECMPSQLSYSENIVSNNKLNDDLSKTTTLSAIKESDVTTHTSLTVTTTETTTERLEIKSPDEFIYNDKLYSIDDLVLSDIKEFIDTPRQDEELKVIRNDDISFAYDEDEKIRMVGFFTNKYSLYNDLCVGMSKDEIINKFGDPISDPTGQNNSLLIWHIDSSGKQSNIKKGKYDIWATVNDNTVTFISVSDINYNLLGNYIALTLEYDENVFFDGEKIAVYVDNQKVFNLNSGEIKTLFMPLDNKEHEVRIENNVLHFGTQKQEFDIEDLEYYGQDYDTNQNYYAIKYKIKYHSLRANYSLEKSDTCDCSESIGFYMYEENKISELDINELLEEQLNDLKDLVE